MMNYEGETPKSHIHPIIAVLGEPLTVLAARKFSLHG
jgi:hypothetical protein